MKKKIIEYREEPRAAGWKFAPGAEPLDEAAQRARGIPEANAPGTAYERLEASGKVLVKPRRGGKRPGAGRKSSGHVRLNLLVPAETKEELKKLAERDRVTLSEAFRRKLAAR
ncbi:MAG: hypothetical protein Q8Q59_12285 [Luteolibacter sp.]|jgi:hypothetical protein|nr:hypothetical protein [Luteolibacter sp.]